MTAAGRPVVGFPPVPPGTIGVEVGPDGSGTYRTADGNVTFTVQLAQVANPQGLRSLGGNLYAPTEASGAAELGNAAMGGRGPLLRGAVELSNVNLVEEMVNLIEVKAAYAANIRAVQTADEMAAALNTLFRRR
jgi:flagellar basal-body rod protein FlgG